MATVFLREHQMGKFNKIYLTRKKILRSDSINMLNSLSLHHAIQFFYPWFIQLTFVSNTLKSVTFCLSLFSINNDELIKFSPLASCSSTHQMRCQTMCAHTSPLILIIISSNINCAAYDVMSLCIYSTWNSSALLNNIKLLSYSRWR